MTWCQPSAIPWAEELRLREGEEAERANRVCCSVHALTRNMLMEGESRVTKKTSSSVCCFSFHFSGGEAYECHINAAERNQVVCLPDRAVLCDRAV